jgi:hypothetical protein
MLQAFLLHQHSPFHSGYKWVLHYQDHFTKFSILRPLKSKTAAEVAYNLLDIFLILGAPMILQSDKLLDQNQIVLYMEIALSHDGMINFSEIG